MILTSIPSPARGVRASRADPDPRLRPVHRRRIIVAVLVTRERRAARGGRVDDVLDVSVWAVPFGVVGGRGYDMITDPELYVAVGRQPIKAFHFWDGGLGIVVAGGQVGKDDLPGDEGEPVAGVRTSRSTESGR